jgi:hypothetical protein
MMALGSLEKWPRDLRQWGAIVVMGAVLAGCGGGGTPEPAKSHLTVPVRVQKMLDKNFPADGLIHVQRVGTFEVNPTTLFCRDASGFMLDNDSLYSALRKINQPIYFKNGYPRNNGKIGVDEGCLLEGQVFVQGKQLKNRNNKPYKLMLAVWQEPSNALAARGAAWVGVIERPDGERPDQAGKMPFNDGIPPPQWVRKSQEEQYRTSLSVTIDIQDMTNTFLNNILDRDK